MPWQAPKSRSLAPVRSRHAEHPRHFQVAETCTSRIVPASLGARLGAMRSACRVMQAIAQLTPMFPALPESAIADALRKAVGNVQQAADILFNATQERAARTLGAWTAS